MRVRTRRRTRLARWLERAALGGIMGMAAFVVERRLLRRLRTRGRRRDRPEPRAPDDVELATSAEQVDHQPRG